MLTSTRTRWGGALAASALVTVGLVATAPSALAGDEAVQGCGASVIDSESAYVDPGVRSSTYTSVTTTQGTFPIRCGDGSTYGAVHIELKHEVPTWAEATSCITKTINRGSESPGGTFTYSFTGGTVRVVTGGPGIVTAYPTGTGVAAKWRTCAGV